MASDTMRRVFAPCTVPERFKRTYPMPLAMRMSQMRTVDEEAAMLLGAAKTLCQFYGKLSVPVRLIAGSHDRIVDTDQHSLRLHLDLASSTFTRLPGVGHMVHHAAPKEVLQAIATVGAHQRRQRRPAGFRRRRPAPDAPMAAHRRRSRRRLGPFLSMWKTLSPELVEGRKSPPMPCFDGAQPWVVVLLIAIRA
jgi:hypothetical protein